MARVCLFDYISTKYVLLNVANFKIYAWIKEKQYELIFYVYLKNKKIRATHGF